MGSNGPGRPAGRASRPTNRRARPAKPAGRAGPGECRPAGEAAQTTQAARQPPSGVYARLLAPARERPQLLDRDDLSLELRTVRTPAREHRGWRRCAPRGRSSPDRNYSALGAGSGSLAYGRRSSECIEPSPVSSVLTALNAHTCFVEHAGFHALRVRHSQEQPAGLRCSSTSGRGYSQLRHLARSDIGLPPAPDSPSNGCPRRHRLRLQWSRGHVHSSLPGCCAVSRVIGLRPRIIQCYT